MNTAKKSSGGGPLDPPFKHNSFRSYCTHKYRKSQYQNIPATKYTILHASSPAKRYANMESQVLPPLLNPLLYPPPPPFFLFAF